jgi:hypothetical protein
MDKSYQYQARRNQMPPTATNVNIRTAQVEIRILSVNGKQMTISVFNQIPNEMLPWPLPPTESFWGKVLHKDSWFCIYQDGDELRRTSIAEEHSEINDIARESLRKQLEIREAVVMAMAFSGCIPTEVTAVGYQHNLTPEYSHSMKLCFANGASGYVRSEYGHSRAVTDTLESVQYPMHQYNAMEFIEKAERVYGIALKDGTRAFEEAGPMIDSASFDIERHSLRKKEVNERLTGLQQLFIAV